MNKNITKNLIILGAIIFSFALANGVSAYYAPNDSANWLIPASYNSNMQNYPYNSSSAYAGSQGYSQYGYYQQPGYNSIPVNPYNNSYSSYNDTLGGYPQNGYYLQSGYNINPEPKTSIVNNYYQTIPATPKVNNITYTTNTTNVPSKQIPANTIIDNTNPNTTGYNNSVLGASAYNSYGQAGSGITALSLHGSGSFMPSSIWQWIFVIILILVIIIIARTLYNKQVILQESHITHAH